MQSKEHVWERGEGERRVRELKQHAEIEVGAREEQIRRELGMLHDKEVCVCVCA